VIRDVTIEDDTHPAGAGIRIQHGGNPTTGC